MVGLIYRIKKLPFLASGFYDAIFGLREEDAMPHLFTVIIIY